MKYIILSSCLLVLVLMNVKPHGIDTVMASVYAMSLEELMNTKVSIATKSDQPLSETPSIVSVITAEDIKNMGARELVDVLQTVPGFELTKNFSGEAGIGIRGVKSYYTSKLLIMIDGAPYNQLFYGTSIHSGYDIDLDAVERIEIIRGPGSALYGRNAFSGVINIITKNGKTDDKAIAKGEVGTFNTKSGSIYYGFKKENINASLALQRIYTDGTDVKFDDGFGHMNQWNISHNNFIMSSNIGIDKFTFSVNYLDLKDGGMLNKMYAFNKRVRYSLSYDNDINPKISIHTKLFGFNTKYVEDIEQHAPDDNIDTLPNGLYYKPQLKEYLYGIETEINYKFFFNNDLLFGIQADKHGVKDVILTSNFDFSTGLFDETRSTQSIFPGWFFKGDPAHNYADYHNVAFFMQDIWRPLKQLGITLGGRYDIDSQIGGIFNPRVGIVWSPVDKGSVKLLYGRAYRAPAPSEQYQTFGYATGNPNLKPEIINTFELAFNYRLEKISNSVSFFLDKLTDIINTPLAINSVEPNIYYNMSKNTSYGVEYENKILLDKSFSSYFNCSYTISKNKDFLEKNVSSVYDAKDVAPLAINLGINYSFLKYFNLNLNMYYRSKMGKLAVQDSTSFVEVQDPIGNYAVFNTTIGANDIIKHLKFSLSVYNMFDAVYYAQENDLLKEPRQPGRQFIFHLSYLFKE